MQNQSPFPVHSGTDPIARMYYVEREIGEIKSTIDKWIGKNEEQMSALARSIAAKEGTYEERFVRNDILKLEFNNINTTLQSIQNLLNSQVTALNEVRDYLPMLKMIRDERADIKHLIMQWASKIIFFIFSVGVAAYAIKK